MTPCQTKVNKIVTLNCIKNDQPYFCYTIDCIYPSTQVMKTCSIGLSNFNVLTEKLQSFPICSTIHSMLFHSLFFKRWKNKKELCLITKLQKGFWPKLILIYHWHWKAALVWFNPFRDTIFIQHSSNICKWMELCKIYHFILQVGG